ncbi:YtxH domain-containing protein [Oscillochloris sp. ZM17-4]|uniref:YtxH domain-containing protein n=1 Tax=Oscillochloris sp. ZM17-4 TaxID=2866714 RepID=UPI001C73333F|nr:YtxH domain-containing protein [Oscillochloris sp. ZM17-4]MBX0330397.1 YtxH domain-containing protein [Oscillochloris sp. ZM17-4]
MTVESETLVEAARRFGEVIQAERTSTITALEAERAAAIKIIEALRKENDRRASAAGGRFVLGFLIGAAIGAVAVSMLVPKSGDERRASLTANIGGARASLSDRLRGAVDAGKQATAAAEQELWAEYRKRVAASQ